MSEVVNAAMLRRALEGLYSPPEWYLGFEVGNSTGASCRRHADAVAVNAYPSKGFETRGFEIKVSKSDLQAELKNGLKADEIARFCDYWFLVIPKGLADGFTLPPTWGVMEFSDGKLRHKIRATKLEKTTFTGGFLCAMLRGRERAIFEKSYEARAETEKRIREKIACRSRSAEDDLKKLRDKLEEVKAGTGIALDVWTPTESIIARLNAAASLEVITRNARAIERSAKALLEDAQDIAEAAKAIKATEGGGA